MLQENTSEAAHTSRLSLWFTLQILYILYVKLFNIKWAKHKWHHYKIIAYTMTGWGRPPGPWRKHTGATGKDVKKKNNNNTTTTEQVYFPCQTFVLRCDVILREAGNYLIASVVVRFFRKYEASPRSCSQSSCMRKVMLLIHY